MKKLKYSPDVREKLKQIRRDVTQKLGIDTANKVIREMTNSFRDLQQFENKGVSVENIVGISCDYRMLYIQHNYALYQIEADAVKIIDIYNEKEDFMRKLFGVKTTMKETEDYWGE
ncbi:MAG: type II toxin-antitoxin system RelE/ParE family toxin [Clostridium sp.]|nr:type II toxin-antitoxin system RelE/ParE family toxin [Roseburia sp.]MCM1099205.1 type II toxin-antitoxin system RelE/ParE family toxin [Ruminococcus flavefaciens]MCM1181671.1 type II toxin-antitoxin system RelE/ParE family toxin [Clostridium sp.]